MKKLAIYFLSLSLSGCSGLSKLDYGSLYGRAVWQLPQRVVESLNIRPGQHIADIGAGDGYFTFLLADQTGPTGKVYAVDVDQDSISAIDSNVTVKGYKNVSVRLGEFEDPLLPDATIDLVFLCNTYHHVQNRRDYFFKLKTDLKPQGRVAVIDMKDDLTGILSFFVTSGHWTPRRVLFSEMEAAGYSHERSFVFLPVQNFEIFSVE